MRALQTWWNAESLRRTNELSSFSLPPTSFSQLPGCFGNCHQRPGFQLHEGAKRAEGVHLDEGHGMPIIELFWGAYWV